MAHQTILPTSDQAWEDDQIEQESQRHTASVGEEIERVERAPEEGTPEILRSLHKTTEPKDCARAEQRGADDPVPEQTHQQDQRHRQKDVDQVSVHEERERSLIVFTRHEMDCAGPKGDQGRDPFSGGLHVHGKLHAH